MQMKIDLTCPVELWEISTPTEEEPGCAIVLNNLSEKMVNSVQLTLVCYDAEEEIILRQTERMQGLQAEPGERFSVLLLPTKWEGVARAELVVEKVWFDTGVIWRRGNGSLTIYRANGLAPGRKLDELRFVAGQDAVGYPEEQGDLWVCVCGRPNAKTIPRCCRCGRGVETVFASYHPGNVAQIIDVHEKKLDTIAKKAREDAAKLAEEREKVSHRQKNRRRNAWRITATTALVIGVAAAWILWGLPAYQYYQAARAMESGRYQDARAGFTALKEYQDAPAQAVHCDYLEAKGWLEEGSRDHLENAVEVFARLGDDYEDSRELGKEGKYQLAELSLEEKQYEQALLQFIAMGSYKDSPEKVLAIQYLQAETLRDGMDYKAAEEAFLALKEYRDAPEQALECRYQVGLMAEAAKDYPEAIEDWLYLGEYQDAGVRLLHNRYALAEQKMNQGELEAAGTLYLETGDYEDAPMKANDSLYQFAQEQFHDGKYEKSREVFTRIIPYLDSENMSWEAAFKQGEKEQEEGNLLEAIDLFETIPEHAGAGEKLADCRYTLATKHLEEGRLTEAEGLLEALGTHRDSLRLLRQTRLEMGKQAAADGLYERAAELFSALGNYSDSPARLKDSQYQLARNALFDKQYEQAIAGLSVLGKYENAAELLVTARQEYAAEKRTAGDVFGALEILGDSRELQAARQELVTTVLAEAQKQKDTGDAAGAEEILSRVGDEPVAQNLQRSWQYQSAMALMQEGKYLEAGSLFDALGAYQDAATQRDECYGRVYGEAAEKAREAFDKKDYAGVIEAVEGVEALYPGELPRGYQDLTGLYRQSCYAWAEALYQQGKAYEALPYYQKISDYRDVPQKLNRRSYQVIGKWENPEGQKAEFRPDGTCTILGEVFYFMVQGYDLLTGKEEGAWQGTHRLTNVSRSGLTLRDVRDGQNSLYKFNRTGDAEMPVATALPTPAATPAPPQDNQEAGNSWTVLEDEDATAAQ